MSWCPNRGTGRCDVCGRDADLGLARGEYVCERCGTPTPRPAVHPARDDCGSVTVADARWWAERADAEPRRTTASGTATARDRPARAGAGWAAWTPETSDLPF